MHVSSTTSVCMVKCKALSSKLQDSCLTRLSRIGTFQAASFVRLIPVLSTTDTTGAPMLVLLKTTKSTGGFRSGLGLFLLIQGSHHVRLRLLIHVSTREHVFWWLLCLEFIMVLKHIASSLKCLGVRSLGS